MGLFTEMMDECGAQHDRIRALEIGIKKALDYIENYDGQHNPLDRIAEILDEALTPEERQ